ncbi:MAG: hypothetical protein ACRCT8_17495 [Lacipirellulaceae bacterium]
MRSLLASFCSVLALATVAGCSGRPAAIRPVSIDAYDASQAALEAYDKNGDAKLDDAELVAVPAVLRYKGHYDKDGDGAVSGDEIRERLDAWADQGMGFRQLTAVVTLDGKPLAGADVLLEPEPFLGEGVKPAKGTTDADGVVNLSMDRADMPPQLAKLPVSGVTGGTFKVRVTHATKKLPAKFNTATVFGEEVAFDTIREQAHIDLKSR